MRLIAVALVLLVGACGGPVKLTAAQQDKLAATQTVVNERVKAGTMTEAEGRLVIANMKADMESEARRNYAIMVGGSGDGGGTYQPVGGGTVVKY